MFSQTTPGFRELERELFARVAQNRPGDKNLSPQGGRLAVRLFWSDHPLVMAQQVESEEHRQESSLGAEEFLHAEAVGRKFVF